MDACASRQRLTASSIWKVMNRSSGGRVCNPRASEPRTACVTHERGAHCGGSRSTDGGGGGSMDGDGGGCDSDRGMSSTRLAARANHAVAAELHSTCGIPPVLVSAPCSRDLRPRRNSAVHTNARFRGHAHQHIASRPHEIHRRRLRRETAARHRQASGPRFPWPCRGERGSEFGIAIGMVPLVQL